MLVFTRGRSVAYRHGEAGRRRPCRRGGADGRPEAGAALAEYAEALADDLRPGCGPHESLTNVGATQRVGEPSAVDTAGIGDSSVGWTTEITVEEHPAHAGLVFVVLGGRATAIQVMSTEVVTADAMVALAQGAATRLG
jgi:hypothetical protein